MQYSLKTAITYKFNSTFDIYALFILVFTLNIFYGTYLLKMGRQGGTKIMMFCLAF